MNHAFACLLLALALALAGGCTRENAAFCCIDPADCAAQGVEEASRLCTDGLSCVDNKCVASTCATAGCAAAAPVCELTTDVCVGCSSSTECTRFPATDVCDMASGACVECVAAMDCDAAEPVCDAMACRTCRLDSECPSGACADDGTCVAEADVVYLSPTGTDALPCSRAVPCRGLLFSVQQTNPDRSHVVLLPGTYDLGSNGASLGLSTTTAARIFIHGGGSTVTGGSSDAPGLTLSLPTTMRDIDVSNLSGSNVAVDVYSSAVFERVVFRGFDGLGVRGQLTARHVEIHAQRYGILNTGSVTLERATIEGGASAIYSRYGTLDVTNLLAYATTGIALDIDSSSGSLAFSTIFSTAGGTDPAGVRCTTAPFTIRSSIVWTPTTPSPRVGVTGCNLATSIVGPIGVVGAMSSDPLFAGPGVNDFHLSGGSPARDAVDAGPPHDFEGDPRPRGVRFDLGADEAP